MGVTGKDPDGRPSLSWDDGSSSVDIISETSVFDEDDVTGEALILDPGPHGARRGADLPPNVAAAPQHIYVDEETAAKVLPAAVLHRTGVVPGAMSPYESFVLDLINGRLSVVEIQRAGLLSREEITRVLLSLLDRNLIGAEPAGEDADEVTREGPPPDFAPWVAPQPDPAPWNSGEASSSDLRWIRPSLPPVEPARGAGLEGPASEPVPQVSTAMPPPAAPPPATLASPAAEPAPIPLRGAVREAQLSVPPELRPRGLLPPPPMIAARLSSSPAAPATLPPAPTSAARPSSPPAAPPPSLVLRTPYDAPQLSELSPLSLVSPSSQWVEVRPSSVPPPAPRERPASLELAPAPEAAPGRLPAEPPPIPLDLPTPLPTLEEAMEVLGGPPVSALYQAAQAEPEVRERRVPRVPSTLPPPLAAASPTPPALPPKLDPSLLRAATPPPAEGQSYGAHRAKQLFEAAMVAKGELDFVSARMNLKLAIAFDPTNLKYQRLFIELGDQSGPAKPAGPRMASHQAQKAYDDGCAAEGRGEIDAAIRCFEAALKHGEHPAVLNRLGVLLAMKKKEYLRAQQLVERALELSPDNGTYTHNLTKILSRRAAEPSPKSLAGSTPSDNATAPTPRKSGLFQRLFGREG